MSDQKIFYEIATASLNRHGEEVCGDQVKISRKPNKTIVVLSDGLGSGIKASILAKLTTEIIVRMLHDEAPLHEVLETVIGTLPVCRVRGLAYATFAIAQIHHTDGRFELVNFDSPPPVLFRNRQRFVLETRNETLCGKALQLSSGTLKQGDFLGLMSDGVMYADESMIMDMQWGADQIAAWLETASKSRRHSAEAMVRAVMDETQRRYGEIISDDATFVGVLARKPRRLMVFTGPPADKSTDEACVDRLLHFDGRRVVCGGTTGGIVAEYLGENIRTDESTACEGIPPVGDLSETDLITEGILTLARTLEMIKDAGGDPQRLPFDRNGAVLLSRELLQADSILFLAGESVNPYYQNPQLPRSISIRRSLVSQIIDFLVRQNKDVTVEWT